MEGGRPLLDDSNNYCIWCLSSYQPAKSPSLLSSSSPTKKRKRKLGEELAEENVIQLQQSYKRQRYKLVLEYLLQCDTVHYLSDDDDDNKSQSQQPDQRRRHVLLQKLVELRKAEDVRTLLYDLCRDCEARADEVMKLHLALEVVQMKLVDKVSSLIDLVVAGSMYGSNEGAKRRMQELEMWLQENNNKDGDGGSDELEPMKIYTNTLLEFQTLIFEGGAKMRNVPCVFLRRCMPISSFTGEERSAVDWAFMNRLQERAEYGSSSINLSDSVSKLRKSPQKKGVKKTERKPRPKKKTIPKSRSNKSATSTPIVDEEFEIEAPTIVSTPKIMLNGWDNSIIKEEPIDINPSSPGVPDYLDSFEATSPYEEPPYAIDVEVKIESPEPSPREKRRRAQPNRFKIDTFTASTRLTPKNVSVKAKQEPTKKDRRKINGIRDIPKSVRNRILGRPKLRLSHRQLRMKLERDRKRKEHEVFSCSTCSFSGRNTYAAVQHLREHETEEKIFKCSETDCEERRFSNKQFYEYHTRLHKTPYIFISCGICSGRFSAPALIPHMKSHENCNIYPCQFCYFCTSNPREFLRHIKHHRKAKGKTTPMICPLCSKVFPNEYDITVRLTDHFYNEHGCSELMMECEFKDCTQTFLTDTGLRSHYDIVHLKRFKCSRCKEAFSSRRVLRDHVNLKHLNMKMFNCEVGDCLQNFKSKCQLQAHQILVHGFPKLKCDLCVGDGSEFTNADALRTFKKRKHGRHTYVCVTCGKPQENLDALKRHEMIHGERNVKCDQCEFRAKSRTQILKHVRNMHKEGALRFECPHCPKKCKQRRAMEEHIRTHTGERPYVCHLCSAAFAKKQAMTNHIKKLHPDDQLEPDKTLALTANSSATTTRIDMSQEDVPITFTTSTTVVNPSTSTLVFMHSTSTNSQ